MKTLTKKMSAIVLCTVFASMQIASAAINTGLGAGNGGAVINNTTGGFAGMTTGTNSATLNFNGDTHVNWNSLNVNSNETLNFNAVNGANNLTILNTVTGGEMTKIYGTVNSNTGISNLIISNPNGMLYDGAHFNAAGDVMLTTQGLTSQFNNGTMTVQGLSDVATKSVTIKDSDFNVGGEFNITAPDISAISSAIKADGGFKMVTRDGQNFLVSQVDGQLNTGVKMESVLVDGDVYITSGKDYVKVVNGGTVNGNMTVDSKGIVALNYSNNGSDFNVTGNLNVTSDGALNPLNRGNFMYLRKSNVDGNLAMQNSGGFLEIEDVNVGGNAALTTTAGANTHVKHFTHVNGYTNINGDLDINSVNNIHVGNYDIGAGTLLPGNLSVGGDLNANADYGHVMVTVNTQADKINLKSNQLNVLTDENSVLTANEYKFSSNGYIGAITNSTDAQNNPVSATNRIISLMENYTFIPKDITCHAYTNLGGGNVTQVVTNTPQASVYLKSNGNMNVNGVNTGNLHITATSPSDPLGGNIALGNNVHADNVVVGGETKNLTLPLQNRDYTLKYTDIKDTAVYTIAPNTEITYQMMEVNPGLNSGVQTAYNTRIIVPGGNTPTDPTDPVDPIIPVDPVNPNNPIIKTQDNDNVKFLNNLGKDQMASAIDAGQVYTPVAFAADLDDEIDTGVRKNVDGSVTVVRPYTPSK